VEWGFSVTGWHCMCPPGTGTDSCPF
jgi:hypothetical protein